MKFWYCLLFAQIACANPVGEVVAGGEVSFSRPSDTELQVLQESDRAVVEWKGFSIDAGEVTKFIQPGTDSVMLNRVTGGDMSAIYGRLEANGQIVLMNPHGVIVGKSGVIDACAFLPTASDISTGDFMNGAWDFLSLDPSSVINVEGRVEANYVKVVGDQIFLTDERTSFFGVNLAVSLSGFLSSFVSSQPALAPTAANVVQNSLEALQELRTLIPERLWVQEFSLLVDRTAFVKHVKAMMEHHRREDMMRSSFVLARSKDYLIRSTMSGENIRMLDRYQEFEQSPFWRAPDAMNRLHRLEQ